MRQNAKTIILWWLRNWWGASMVGRARVREREEKLNRYWELLLLCAATIDDHRLFFSNVGWRKLSAVMWPKKQFTMFNVQCAAPAFRHRKWKIKCKNNNRQFCSFFAHNYMLCVLYARSQLNYIHYVRLDLASS